MSNRTRTIYGSADVANALGVARNVVSNHLKRHADTPPAAFETPDGRKFWNDAGIASWRVWHARIARVRGDR